MNGHKLDEFNDRECLVQKRVKCSSTAQTKYSLCQRAKLEEMFFCCCWRCDTVTLPEKADLMAVKRNFGLLFCMVTTLSHSIIEIRDHFGICRIQLLKKVFTDLGPQCSTLWLRYNIRCNEYCSSDRVGPSFFCYTYCSLNLSLLKFRSFLHSF